MTFAKKSPSDFNGSALTESPDVAVVGKTGPVLPDHLLDTRELASAIKLSPRTAENWRLKGTGPKYLRVGGRRILYRWGDVIEYLNGRRFLSTTEEQAANLSRSPAEDSGPKKKSTASLRGFRQGAGQEKRRLSEARHER